MAVKKSNCLVYRKPCNLHAHHAHHRYETDFFKPLTFGESKYQLVLTHVRKLSSSCIYISFSNKCLAFSSSWENLVPQGQNGFYILLLHSGEEVLLSMVMLSQQSTLITYAGLPTCASDPSVLLGVHLTFLFMWKRKS